MSRVSSGPAKAQALFTDRPPRLIQAALTDGKAIRAAADGCDVVFHVAGITSARSRAEFFRVNEGGTVAVLEHLPPTVRRFVYVSSLAAAGPARRGVPHDGQEHRVTHCGASSRRSWRRGRTDLTIIRPPAVYGPRDVEFLRFPSRTRPTSRLWRRP
jgi:nucleoside-diphosphate-sugar epimerase